MDPISFGFAIAAATYQSGLICQRLHGFIKSTKGVSSSVKGLIQEISSLQKALQAAARILQNKSILKAEDYADRTETEEFWQSVHGTIVDCKVTLEKLWASVETVSPEHSSRGSQLLRAIKLNLKENEIQTLKDQVRTHIGALQMSVQLINLRAIYLAPDAVVDTLEPKINELQKSMDRLSTGIRGSEGVEKSLLTTRGLKSQNADKFHKTALKVLSSAVTACGSSTNDDTSVAGKQMDEATRKRTLSWIPDLEGEDSPNPEMRVLDSTDLTVSPISSRVTDVQREPQILVDEDGVFDSGSDSDFENDIATKNFQSGFKAFQESNYHQAEKSLRKGLIRANRLPVKRRKSLDIRHAQFALAACAYYLDDLDRAIGLLSAVTKGETDTMDEAAMCCRARHLLACTYFRQRNYGAAKKACLEARKGRKLTLGKGHKDYFETLDLLAQIIRAQPHSGEDEEEAEYVEDMIPKELVGTFPLLEPWGIKCETAEEGLRLSYVPELELPPPSLNAEDRALTNRETSPGLGDPLTIMVSDVVEEKEGEVEVDLCSDGQRTPSSVLTKDTFVAVSPTTNSKRQASLSSLHSLSHSGSNAKFWSSGGSFWSKLLYHKRNSITLDSFELGASGQCSAESNIPEAETKTRPYSIGPTDATSTDELSPMALWVIKRIEKEKNIKSEVGGRGIIF